MTDTASPPLSSTALHYTAHQWHNLSCSTTCYASSAPQSIQDLSGRLASAEFQSPFASAKLYRYWMAQVSIFTYATGKFIAAWTLRFAFFIGSDLPSLPNHAQTHSARQPMKGELQYICTHEYVQSTVPQSKIPSDKRHNKAFGHHILGLIICIEQHFATQGLLLLLLLLLLLPH
jgi:hypothetical protein